MNIIFLCDIVVTFLSPYYDEDLIIVDDPRVSYKPHKLFDLDYS